jgi:hypothetical protein
MNIQLSSGWNLIAGSGMVLFGWFYPHFLETSSLVPYVYAAPTGLIPCPTLSMLTGLILMLRGLGSRTFSFVFAALGLFYGMFGVVRLGVWLDLVLLIGSLVLVWGVLKEKWGASDISSAPEQLWDRTVSVGLPAKNAVTGGSSSASIGTRLLVLAGLLTLILACFFLFVRPWYLRWGAADEELNRMLPGDEIVPHAAGGETRAITINAPVEQVWPWLAQLGQDRGGFYSFEVLENLVGCEMPAANRILPDKQSWKVGDRLWMYPPDKADGVGFATLRAYIPGHAMGFGTRFMGTSPSRPDDGSWSFVLEPLDDGTTRFLVRGRGAPGRSLLGVAFDRSIFEPVHFVMERRMMLDLKQLAEGGARDHTGNTAQVVLWTLTFVFFVAAIVQVVRRAAWGRPLAALFASAIVFQILTLGQPSVVLGIVLVAAVGALLWWPRSPAEHVVAGIAGGAHHGGIEGLRPSI